MKTIEQLLELSKNPYYKFTKDEEAVLNDFLLQKRASDLQKSQKKTLTGSLPKTNVTVRNIVTKVNTYPPEAI